MMLQGAAGLPIRWALEGPPRDIAGMGLLDVEPRLRPENGAAPPNSRAAILSRVSLTSSGAGNDRVVDAALDELASEFEAHLGIDGPLKLARETGQ